MPPTRTMRYCCEVLKEHGGEGKVKITGVRWDESTRRAESSDVVNIIGVNPTLVSKGPSAVCYGFPLGFRAENTNIYNECATTICNGTRPGFCNGVCYNICSDKSNSMLSDNPYSGIYETDVTRTLDGNGGNPSCNQGGTVIVQELIDWIVRRLTPRECERLQGYPDDWTVLPKIKDMSEADYLFFRDVFCTYRAINGKTVKKTPTKEQIVKWYNKLDKDSPRYRALGNSLAIPCALRVLDGIAETWKGCKTDA